MPHVIVKLWTGRSERHQACLAEEICQAVMSSWGADASSISVAVEDIDPGDWREKEYTGSYSCSRNAL